MLSIIKFKIIKKPSSIIEEGFFVKRFNFLKLVTESQKRRDKYE